MEEHYAGLSASKSIIFAAGSKFEAHFEYPPAVKAADNVEQVASVVNRQQFTAFLSGAVLPLTRRLPEILGRPL